VVADSDRARVLTRPPTGRAGAAEHPGADTRYGEVARVLYQVLFLNLAVAFAKIALGTYTGSVSIVSDGYHSLTDSASNVVGLVGISIARQPPDEEHPYGHRKYETMASVGILIFLILVLVEVVSSAVAHFRQGGSPRVFPEGIALMCATLVINLVVVWYETRAGKRLNSELLLADSKHTRSDVLTTIAVIGALLGVWAGYPLLDPLAALLVAVFIGHACWEIAQQASRILGDTIVIAEPDVRAVIAHVPGVLGCEKIRTRGSADYAFLDLHLWIDGDTPLMQAHATSHVVKDLLMTRFPQLADVVIHIEPPPTTAPARSS
jgi:cation diffusion facilitator family transporter